MRILFYAILFLFFSSGANAQIIINEISYNPPEVGTDSLEYIELYNAGFATVDMTGWYFSAGVEDTFPSVQLAPGEYFVTAWSAEAMMNVFHVNTHEWLSGALSNNGESIVLLDAAGNFIDSVAFDDVDPWPGEPDGNGPSLELKDASLDNNDGANWQFSGGSTGVIINGNEVKGTPGAENSGGGTAGPAVTVNLQNLQFIPQNVVIAIGDSVRWVNQEFIEHNVNGSQSVFPDNPESFLSGLAIPGPWQYDHEFTIAGLNHYQCDPHVSAGMNGTVSVYDPAGYTPFPLLHLRLTDGVNGQHIFNGVPTIVRGVVHGINFQPSGYSFFIIDENNVGINVFSFDPGTYTVTEGDELEIKGVIDQFNGLLEIIPDEITVLSTGNTGTAPESITELNESTEGSHVFFGHFITDSIVHDATGFNMYVKDWQGNPALIRVDADLGLTENDVIGMNGVRGIGSQFDPNFPFIDGYQIMGLEFMILFGVDVIDRDAIKMHPNPASTSITLQSEDDVQKIEIFSMEGRLLTAFNCENDCDEIGISSLHTGIYIVKATLKEGIWTSLLSVIK